MRGEVVRGLAALIVAAGVSTVSARAVGPTTQPAKGSEAAALSAATKPVANGLSKQKVINLAWQIALEQANFSPGLLDAAFGPRCKQALAEYAAAQFPGVDPYSPKIAAALGLDVDHAITTYTITDDDQAQVSTVPDDWNDRAAIASMSYSTLLDELLEKFHVARGLLQAMNPGVRLDLLAVGQTLNVPNLRPFPEAALPELATRKPDGDVPRADHLTINLTAKTIRAFDAEGKQIALFWCSVAKDKAKLPTRDAVVKEIIPNPNYTFNPEMYPEVKDVDHILTIPPGPRNPVGVMFMQLDLPGYGMHGTPHPEQIGKTGSHGCFRMTNWDAIRLSTMVHRGMVVKMVGADVAAASQPTDGSDAK
jgi:hypothetical protein